MIFSRIFRLTNLCLIVSAGFCLIGMMGLRVRAEDMIPLRGVRTSQKIQPVQKVTVQKNAVQIRSGKKPNEAQIFNRPIPAHTVRNIKGMKMVLKPQEVIAPHRHPVPVIGSVRKGEIVLQLAGGKSQTLKAGDSYFIPADATVLHFSNPSMLKKAEVTSMFLLDGDNRPLTEMLQK